MLNFKEIIREIEAKTPQDIFNHFKESKWKAWVDEYLQESHGFSGDITCQGFWGGFQFILDHTSDWKPAEFPTCNIPEDRVIAAFGISTAVANKLNRKIMANFRKDTPKLFDRFGAIYNKGHFIAHAMGGPIDINLFPQIAHVNLGRSTEGKMFRSMEKYITSHPGTFVFSRPVYGDFSECPIALEYGYCEANMEMVYKIFPNRP